MVQESATTSGKGKEEVVFSGITPFAYLEPKVYKLNE
jgi:hypothetical protein